MFIVDIATRLMLCKWLRHISLAAAVLLNLYVAVRAQTAPSGGHLPTKWDVLVSPTAPWPEYPRPQMVRTRWLSLNGSWDYAVSTLGDATVPSVYTGKILVPFPYESALSGCGEHGSIPDRLLWYHRIFTLPSNWSGSNVLLHFGAVNYTCSVIVNGKAVGSHTGGYTGFTFDISDAIKPGPNDIVISVNNPLKTGVSDAQVLGKQRPSSGSIWYTASTGIWQTVWLEPVPKTSISEFHLVPNIDTSSLSISIEQAGPPVNTVTAIVQDQGKTLVSQSGPADAGLNIVVPHPVLWSPTNPHLYSIELTLREGSHVVDAISSYFAMRKISIGSDSNGLQKILLNNQPLLEIGLLDQGYWPDGIYTAPTDSAMLYDIQEAKFLGFNMLRKHAKVEPDRWYYDCDRLGVLVWQDMPQCFGAGSEDELSDAAIKEFHLELIAEIKEFWNHPSIIVWTTFNEGWGEHDVPQIVADVKALDPSRLVDDASGWTDMNVGDIDDHHEYPGPGSDTSNNHALRAVVNGEFGGLTERIPGHMWTNDVFGYGGAIESSLEITSRYQQLLKNAYSMAQTDGTSAFVYTQLTDVEQESNGLLTYDRAVLKPDANIVRAANRGQFPALSPGPPSVVPTAQ